MIFFLMWAILATDMYYLIDILLDQWITAKTDLHFFSVVALIWFFFFKILIKKEEF